MNEKNRLVLNKRLTAFRIVKRLGKNYYEGFSSSMSPQKHTAIVATVTGFEPIPSESKSDVLPLHYTARMRAFSPLE